MSKTNYHKGYLKINREIMNTPFWVSDEKYDDLRAWLYINFKANYADQEKIDHHKLRIQKRGQMSFSLRQLADVFHWDKDTVSNFLNMLEQMGLIYQDRKTYSQTVITLVNYCIEQDNYGLASDAESDTVSDTKSDTLSDAESDLKSDYYKKEKESTKKALKKQKEKPSAHFDSCGVVYEE